MAETAKQKEQLKLYNTAEKRVEGFKPLHTKEVKIYSCGPTVYNFAHIGNLRTYLNVDVLRRSLEYLGYKVRQVTNITDVEDKIIRDTKVAGLNPENKSDLKKFTQKYEEAFFKDLEELNIEKAEVYPHATDEATIKKMIEVVQYLLNKSYAYETDDGIYFSISKLKDYGKLTNIDKTAISEGSRISADEYDKEDIRDFALWKKAKPGEPSWNAPFGAGRPGWHIECTAMALLNLGEQVDIHAGGVDLVFPHHENEIAQTESFTGKTFSHYWYHPEMLLVEGQKMSKKLNNFYTLSEMSEKFKVEPLAFRMLVLMSHYRDRLNFTHSNIIDAQNTLENLRNFVRRLKETQGVAGKKISKNLIKKTELEFRKALADDISMPKAMAVIFDFIKKTNKEIKNGKDTNDILDFILDIDNVLGLGLSDIKKDEIPKSVIELVKEREKWRKTANYEMSDKIRRQIEAIGYTVEDTPKGPFVKKLS